MDRLVYLALGSNLSSSWGSPGATLARAIGALGAEAVRVVAASQIYVTAPIGQTDQPDYVNCVVAARTRLHPATLLLRLKAIERRAGRGRGRRWGARTLDIDIIDYDGRRRGDPRRKMSGSLILPHPEMHRRPFVVIPLAEIAPRWRHPLTRDSVALLRRSLNHHDAGRILDIGRPCADDGGDVRL